MPGRPRSPGHRGDRSQRARALAFKDVGGQTKPAHRPDNVSLHHRALFHEVDPGRHGRHDARRIDHHPQRRQLLEDTNEKPRRGVVVGDIGDVGEREWKVGRGMVRRVQVAGEGIKLLLAARDERDAIPITHQLASKRGPDSRGRADDQRPLPAHPALLVRHGHPAFATCHYPTRPRQHTASAAHGKPFPPVSATRRSPPSPSMWRGENRQGAYGQCPKAPELFTSIVTHRPARQDTSFLA